MTPPEPQSTQPALTPSRVRAGILLLTLLAYLPILRQGFVFDDGWTFVSNGFLRYPSHWFTLLDGTAAARNIPDPFRPVMVGVDMWTYHAFGLNARGHHLMSIALHLLTCVCLDGVLAQQTASPRTRMASLAAFAVLGVHAEAIAVVSYREDLLAASLGLAAIWVVGPIHASTRERAIRWVVGAMLMCAATSAKLSAAPLPVFAWLLWSWSRWRPPPSRARRALASAALVVGVGLALLLRWSSTGRLLPYEALDPRLVDQFASASDRGATALMVSLRALGQSLVPLGLSPEYTPPTRHLDTPLVTLAAALTGAVTLWLLVRWRRRSEAILPLSLLGWLVMWLPVSNLAPLPNLAADRYAYLPSIALAIGLGALFDAAWVRGAARWQRQVVTAVGVAFIVVHGSLGLTATRAFASNHTLWETASTRAPLSARAHAMHGIMLLTKLDLRPEPSPQVLSQTAQACARGHALDPTDAHPHLCAARLAIVEKRWRDAIAHLDTALQYAPVRRDSIEAARLEILPDAMFGAAADDELRTTLLTTSTALLRDAPYSPAVFHAVGRVLHRLGLDTQAGMAYRASHLRRPEHVPTAVARIELALDRGDLLGARALWLQYDGLRQRVHESQRTALDARFSVLGRFPRQTLIWSPDAESTAPEP